MVPVMQQLIGATLEQLRQNLLAANHRGNIEGLLARHVLSFDTRVEFPWDVDCDAGWLRESYDQRSLPSVAALAFTVDAHGDAALLKALEEGMLRAVDRDPAAASQSAALRSPAVLVGVVLGARCLAEQEPQCLQWCGDVLLSLRPSAGSVSEGFFLYVSSLLGRVVQVQHELDSGVAAELAVADWRLSLPGPTPLSPVRRRELRRCIVGKALTEEPGQRPAYEAALVWRAMHLAVSEETTDLLRSPGAVVQVLEQFEHCMKRWRWDSDELKQPIRWPVVSEREVQDILYLMLRAVFADVTDEDTLPKFGHSTYRADFSIPGIGVLVEVKFARAAGDFKTIEKEVLEDIVPYLKSPNRYDKVVVFIYDHSSSVQMHDTTRRALSSVDNIAGVIVVSRPSQLPLDQLENKAKATTQARAKRPPSAG